MQIDSIARTIYLVLYDENAERTKNKKKRNKICDKV